MAGPCIWFHFDDPDLTGFAQLCMSRLVSDIPDARLVLTHGDMAQDDILALLNPFDPPAICLWGQGGVQRRVMQMISDLKIPLIFFDLVPDRIEPRRWFEVSRRTRSPFARAIRLLLRDAAAFPILKTQGVANWQCETLGPLEVGQGALPYDEAEYQRLLPLFQTRMVWLACGVRAEEIGVVLAAAEALRNRSVRALLILQPDRPEDIEDLFDACTLAGFHTTRRDFEAEPDDSSAIFLTDGPEELGLWYRLAPVTYMGGSLSLGSRRSPLEPAALGSAILHGGRFGPFGMAYKELSKADATQRVRRAERLGEAIETLLEPHQAAVRAHAAWDVTSAGADGTDRIIELILNTLDDVGA